jgi:hypothetical protein
MVGGRRERERERRDLVSFKISLRWLGVITHKWTQPSVICGWRSVTTRWCIVRDTKCNPTWHHQKDQLPAQRTEVSRGDAGFLGGWGRGSSCSRTWIFELDPISSEVAKMAAGGPRWLWPGLVILERRGSSPQVTWIQLDLSGLCKQQKPTQPPPDT